MINYLEKINHHKTAIDKLPKKSSQSRQKKSFNNLTQLATNISGKNLKTTNSMSGLVSSTRNISANSREK